MTTLFIIATFILSIALVLQRMYFLGELKYKQSLYDYLEAHYGEVKKQKKAIEVDLAYYQNKINTIQSELLAKEELTKNFMQLQYFVNEMRKTIFQGVPDDTKTTI